ncbi:hypothetical protein SB748_31940, partial [Rhizobium sp. SIMBA_035]
PRDVVHDTQVQAAVHTGLVADQLLSGHVHPDANRAQAGGASCLVGRPVLRVGDDVLQSLQVGLGVVPGAQVGQREAEGLEQLAGLRVRGG